MQVLQVSPEQILPSQDFLKERTVQFIFDCLQSGRLDELPPTPLVRYNEAGQLVAIDGHNIIAVRLHRHEMIEVVVASSPTDGLLDDSEASKQRNRDLAEKFDTVLDEQRKVAAAGIVSFGVLVGKYPELFPQAA